MTTSKASHGPKIATHDSGNMPITTHLYLVSAQATPNLTPALDPATRPRRVILLVSADMRGRARWLETVLTARGTRVESWGIDDPWDLERIQTQILELLEREKDQVARGTLALNATGGTKPMSIAAYEAFRAYDLPIFYVHPERDRLIWLHPGGMPARDLENRLRLEPFLQAHGARVTHLTREGIPPHLSDLTHWLASQARTFAPVLGTLNYLAMKAEQGLVSPAMEDRDLANHRFQALLHRLGDAGLFEVRQGRLRFPDEAARFYVNGGWLEEHVHDLLRLQRGGLPQMQDLARSLAIVHENPRGDQVPNEIDVACLAENRLYIVECKTRAWGGGDASSPGADALYRLGILGDLLGGLQAQAMLVSFRELPAPVLRRAADLRIRVCAGSRLQELGAHLRAWLEPRTRASR